MKHKVSSDMDILRGKLPKCRASKNKGAM